MAQTISVYDNFIIWPSRVTLAFNLPKQMFQMNKIIHTEIMFILKALKSHLKGSYEQQNLTLMDILYDIYETCRRLVS